MTEVGTSQTSMQGAVDATWERQPPTFVGILQMQGVKEFSAVERN